MKRFLLLLTVVMMTFSSQAKQRTVKLKWLHTSDIHGALFSYNYFSNKIQNGGLSSFYAYSQRMKKKWGENLIMTDGGDCLQGQPTSYYYNYIDTLSPHLVAQTMNDIGYTAGAMGNHDIETGHAVYDRWVKQLKHPVLGANIIDQKTKQPYLKPYMMIEKEGVKIAILGMITPAIPNWLPRTLWSGLEFEEMTSSASKWLKIIKETEKPDLIVGLFHSGYEGGIKTSSYAENATLQVAQEVPGFDLILYGHDHRAASNLITSADGSTTLCVGPSSLGMTCSEVDLSFTIDDGKVTKKSLKGKNNSLPYKDDPATHLFEISYEPQCEVLREWLSHPVANLEVDMHERDAFFGPSLFIDFIHQMQLELTGAQISFAAPISFDSHMLKGMLHVSDMFSMYKYENFLYTMRLTGAEIKGFLEMSYELWSNQMQNAEDHCLLLDYVLDDKSRLGLKNLSFNMDSAAGIYYTVDVTKPAGQRITITSLADGTPFSLTETYLVATNSYRANGGGELMTRGAGIAQTELSARIVNASSKDLRYLIMEKLRQTGSITPRLLNCWKFVPEEWTKPALERDRAIIFPSKEPSIMQH